ncbi:helix-turn-helix domain-containing protein [Streptomyces lonarensis]|uniref:Helix-turn-helix domain-containing protein n=1 Tax=Streptomyces lonarensis TaxID=700599 RepID=A0A7X6CXN3_9ACTN|nr:helix-turn-helix domain-containing protein [Streptomyces lonarensis]NJQ04309.1 helix-turn-helix domain-containing protein [Streptomyces lonarensis]
MTATTRTTAEAAEWARVSPSTVAAWCRAGVVAATKVGGRWVIEYSSLLRRIVIGDRARFRREAKVRGHRHWNSDHPYCQEFDQAVADGAPVAEVAKYAEHDTLNRGQEHSLARLASEWRAHLGLATDRQIDYILKILAWRERHGESDGFMHGPTDRAGIARLTKQAASTYITSLTGSY